MSISMQDTIQPVSHHPRSLREALEPGEENLLTRIVIDRAKCGDAAALRFVLGQLYPRPRGRAIVLDLPAEVRSGNVVAVFDATLEAMTEGRITPEEARAVTLVLDGRLRLLETWERELNLERDERFASGGLIYPKAPVFRWREDDDKPEPPGFTAAWAKYEAEWAEYEAKRAEVQAQATPSGRRRADPPQRAGEGEAPANHLHLQAAVSPADGVATGKGETGAAVDHLHSACISQEEPWPDLTGAAFLSPRGEDGGKGAASQPRTAS
jgi:hypothetical protein